MYLSLDLRVASKLVGESSFYTRGRKICNEFVVEDIPAKIVSWELLGEKEAKDTDQTLALLVISQPRKNQANH